MKQIFFLLLIASCCLLSCSPADKTTVASPDKTIELSVEVEHGNLYYQVQKSGNQILNKSLLGFTLNDGPLGENLEITNVAHATFSEQWDQVWGEEITVDNTYNEMTVTVKETTDKQRTFDVIFRVFNDGIGFRYHFPTQENLDDFVIMDELTEFALAKIGEAWSIPARTEYYEGLYQKAPVNTLDTVCGPLTIEVSDGSYLTLHEANLTDYAAINFTPVAKSNRLKVDLTPWSTGEKVFVKAPFSTPWRTVIIADNPGDLILSRIMLNLNEPNKIEDTSWVEPGRYVGIWWGMHTGAYTWHQGPKHGATTANTKRYIDFASKHGFDGVLVEGWNYGWDSDWTKEGDKFSFTKAYPDYDLFGLAEYAKSKGVRLIGHHETGGATKNYEAQLDSAFALCQRLGINAVKTGYVSPKLDGKEYHSSQYGVRHYRKVIETAAKYHVMIDNHEPVMPTGLQRTYPNLMTQEGVRGQEYDAFAADGGSPPEHTTILPFTRGLAGPMDFTPGTFKYEDNILHPNTRPRTTRAKQLALSVILFSPLQMASDMVENYERIPAFEFITSCPTSWAKTVVPEAKIGEYVTIARKDRDSDNWFIGSITDAESRDLILPLSFLDQGATYRAKIFKDGKDADFNKNPYPVDIEEMDVNAETTLHLKRAAGGGAAIILTRI